MRKTIISKAAVGLVAMAIAFTPLGAKAMTEGNLLGATLYYSHFHIANHGVNQGQKLSMSEFGSFGVSYEYNWSLDMWFAGGRLFYDHLDMNAKFTNGDGFKIKDRYGAKLTFGYDITQIFSIFVGAGVVRSRYEINRVDTSGVLGKFHDNEFIYSVGIGLDVSEPVRIRIEYTTQEARLRDVEGGGKYKFTPHSLGIGLDLKF